MLEYLTKYYMRCQWAQHQSGLEGHLHDVPGAKPGPKRPLGLPAKIYDNDQLSYSFVWGHDHCSVLCSLQSPGMVSLIPSVTPPPILRRAYTKSLLTLRLVPTFDLLTEGFSRQTRLCTFDLQKSSPLASRRFGDIFEKLQKILDLGLLDSSSLLFLKVQKIDIWLFLKRPQK